jgi:NADPH-dependent ferric siderophore reductase
MNSITQKAIALIERRLVKTATVLAVRAWDPAHFLEIDLHLPGCDMGKWKEAQHMKCKVGPLSYRDYTPSGWDVDTQTCTLYVDAGHTGPGSQWAKKLQRGDQFSYMGVGSSHHQPIAGKRLVFLGDETAIGHFLALQQLAGDAATFTGAIAFSERHHQEEFALYFAQSGLHPLNKARSGEYYELEDWVMESVLADPSETIFYLAGHIPAMLRIRNLLKERGIGRGQVKMQGFWN